MKISPIFLAAYNRPSHTEKVLNSLIQNPLAKESYLYVLSDGPKNDDDLNNVKQVRKLIRLASSKFNKTTLILSKENKGLVHTILSGVDCVLEKYNKIIVLEDDIVVSRYFLKYMNTALSLYNSEERVMHINGYFPNLDTKDLEDTFFHNQTSSWGWATWKRSWKHLELDPNILLNKLIQTNKLELFQVHRQSNFLWQLVANIEGSLYSWAIKWMASVAIQNGFVLNPKWSQVSNIGFDGSGVHGTSSDSKYYQISNLKNRVKVNKIPIVESKEARQLMADFFAHKTGGSCTSKGQIKMAENYVRDVFGYLS